MRLTHILLIITIALYIDCLILDTNTVAISGVRCHLFCMTPETIVWKIWCKVVFDERWDIPLPSMSCRSVCTSCLVSVVSTAGEHEGELQSVPAIEYETAEEKASDVTLPSQEPDEEYCPAEGDDEGILSPSLGPDEAYCAAEEDSGNLRSPPLGSETGYCALEEDLSWGVRPANYSITYGLERLGGYGGLDCNFSKDPYLQWYKRRISILRFESLLECHWLACFLSFTRVPSVQYLKEANNSSQ